MKEKFKQASFKSNLKKVARVVNILYHKEQDTDNFLYWKYYVDIEPIETDEYTYIQ